jgi:T4 RnlA family RNA ligase
MKYLPTYNEAVNLVKMENSPFYEMVNIIDGYKISVFNYRLATTDNFKIDGSIEMRGLTFVFDLDGSLYKRYLLIHKFFNLNQTEYTQYDIVKNLTIKNVYNKEDGSLATFIKLPNGKVIGKTKMGFDNDQSISINEIYRNDTSIKKLVDYLLDNNLIPIFEYVAPDNKIVLNYFKKNLILLKVRNNDNGEYIDLDSLGKITSNISIAEMENHSLDNIIKLAKVLEDKEGWVVEFTNGLFIKIKTEWYLKLHMLLTEDVQRENKLIEYILDEKIDDVLSQIPLNDLFTRKKIENISKIVLDEVNILKNKIDYAYSEYLKMNISFKDYAINNKKGNNMFSFVALRVKNEKLKSLSLKEINEYYNSYEDYVKILKNTESYNISKDYIRKITSRLIESRKWLEKLEN